MWEYAWGKARSPIKEISADALITLLSLGVAFLVAAGDPLQIVRWVEFNRDLFVFIYFLFSIAAFVLAIVVFHLLRALIFRKQVGVWMTLSTKQGRPVHGRYLVLYIQNRSLDSLINVEVRLVNARRTDGKWIPSRGIMRQDAFLWGSKMIKVSALNECRY